MINIQIKKTDLENINVDNYGNIKLVVAAMKKVDEKTKATHTIYVDDFVLTGSCGTLLNELVQQTRVHASTTPPIINPSTILGIEIERNQQQRTISLTMTT
jgi:hypothetical protein